MPTLGPTEAEEVEAALLPQEGRHFWPVGTTGLLCGVSWTVTARYSPSTYVSTGVVDRVTCLRCQFLMARLGYSPWVTR